MEKEIQRYDHWESENCMKPYNYGEYVRFEDVEDLIECDRIEQKIIDAGLVSVANSTERACVSIFELYSTKVLYSVTEPTKLKALQKAEKWLDERVGV